MRTFRHFPVEIAKDGGAAARRTVAGWDVRNSRFGEAQARIPLLSAHFLAFGGLMRR
jgi:hypothetical protein